MVGSISFGVLLPPGRKGQQVGIRSVPMGRVQEVDADRVRDEQARLDVLRKAGETSPLKSESKRELSSRQPTLH